MTRPAPGFDGYAPKSSWARFWFQPTDPTTLGFMRIITGLLVLYIHLAYCFDFKSFVGPDGWWGQDDINRERAEAPAYLAPWGWDEFAKYNRPTIPTPPVVDRRAAVFDFLKNLPEDKVRRDADLAYLYLLLDKESRARPVALNNYAEGLMLLKRSAAFIDEQRERMVAGLGQEKIELQKLPLTLPDFFLQMPASERVRVWNESQRLLTLMPANDANFNYLLDWLLELNPDERGHLLKFLKELKGGAEGRRTIEYFEVWRQEPDKAYSHGRYIFSVWFHIKDPATMWACHILILFVIVMFTFGMFTRVTSMLTWLAALFYIHRNQQVLFGMDTMMNILLFYLMIGPSGAALSVDRLIARWRAAKAIDQAGGNPVPWAEAVLAGPQPSSLANFTIRLFQIHFCFIYMASGLAKLKGTLWWDTTATWYTIANPEFCPLMQFPIYERALHALASARPLLMIVFAGAAYFTLFIEISLPFLVWTRLRPVVVTLGIFLHSGIAWIMGLTCFGLLMMAMLLCYMPSAVIRDRLTWATGSGPKMVVRYNSRNTRWARLAHFLRAFDLSGQLTVQDDAGNNAAADMPVQLIGDDGRPHTGYNLFAYAWKKLTFLNLISWVLWLPGVSMLIRWLLGVPGPTATIGKGPSAVASMSKRPTAS